jgi:hypothetical protein
VTNYTVKKKNKKKKKKEKKRKKKRKKKFKVNNAKSITISTNKICSRSSLVSLLFSPRLLFSMTSTPNWMRSPEKTSRTGLSSPLLHRRWLLMKVPLLLFVS